MAPMMQESAACDAPPHTHRLGDLERVENVLLAHRLDFRRLITRQRPGPGLRSLRIDLLAHRIVLLSYRERERERNYPFLIIPSASSSSRPAFISAATGAPSD